MGYRRRRKSQNVTEAIGALKYRLNQIIPLYIGAMKNLSSIYQLPSGKEYALYSEAKEKYAILSQLIHLLETSYAPEQILASTPSL